MHEYFLHYVWRHRLFNTSNLRLESGEELTVLHPGFYNRDAGPDFQESLLRIGSHRWMGSVELHVNSSEWKAHGHSNDPAYENVILHVVWKHEEEVLLTDGTRLPVLTLEKRVDKALLKRYRLLNFSPEPIPCARHWKGHFPTAAWQMLERAAAERLEKRTEKILKLVDDRQGDWEAAGWLWLARAFGQRVNADAFERLAGSLPWKTIQRLAGKPLQLEAALFGQAGFLNEPEGEYTRKLKKEYQFVAAKHKLRPPLGLQWKRLRMFPASFPERRLQQLYQMVQQHPRVLADLLEAKETSDLHKLFEVFEEEETAFGDKQPMLNTARPGRETMNRWLINCAVPLVFAYGHFHQLPALTDKALYWLESLAAEENQITRQYEKLGLKVSNALQSQGLLELHAVYCNSKRCLDCLIGNHWLLKAPP